MEEFSAVPGVTLDQRFLLIEPIGAGGMGTVYRARDLISDEAVAVKILAGRDATALLRFEREAQVLKELRHPGIVRYIAHGRLPSGGPYLAMEWLDGEDLSRRLMRQPFNLAEVIDLGLAVASALDAAHSHGIIHRDIKPANLFLIGGEARRVKLLDFGIARLFGAGAATRTGTVIGTPDYMAPEQVRGERDIDGRADLFSLGCVLYECLTRRTPFASEQMMGVFAKILFEPPPDIADHSRHAPTTLRGAIMTMLEKNRTQRTARASLVIETLSTIALPKTDPQMDDPRSLTMPVPPPRALTVHEQRILSIVVITPNRYNIAGALTVEAIPGAASIELLSSVGHSFGARCELLPDGTLLALLFGQATPLDQARQAARFALRIRERFEARENVEQLPPPAHIVVCTGWGELERGMLDAGAIERAVDLSSRLAKDAARATPAEKIEASSDAIETAAAIPILLDETTRGFLDEHFLIDLHEGFALLRAEQPIVEPLRRVLGRSTPFFGRERELGLLTAHLNACIDEPRAGAALVIAEPGMGKSRLYQEFVQRAAATQDLTVWLGRGDPLRQGSPHGLLAQSLRRALAIAEGLLPAQQRERLHEKLSRAKLSELGRVEEFLGEILGLTPANGASDALLAARTDPLLMGDQLRRAVLDLLDAETRSRPLLWILEDLHWGDLPTVRIIDAALRQLAEKPFCVVALARPSIRELFPHLWEGREVQELHLAALTRKASEKIARAVLGEKSSPETLRMVLDRAAGNPFLLEELLRAAASGQLAEVPSTVLAMVQSRIERLEPEARRVLRGACVFGSVFYRGGVAALLGQEARPAEVTQWLEILCEREFIARRAESRFENEVEYTFVHALVRDAAYAMLTDEDRALGHRLAGEFLEQAGAGDALTMAEHWERGGTLPRAVLHYRRAAWGALEGNDFDAALHHAERAIACGASGADLGDARAVQVEVHQWRGELAEAITRAGDALQDLPERSSRWFQVLGAMVVAVSRTFDRQKLHRLAAEISRIGEAGESSDAFIITAARTTLQLYLLGDGEGATVLVQILQRFFDPNRPPPAPATEATLYMLRGFQSMLTGRMDLAMANLERSAVLFERIGDLRNACSQRLDAVFFFEELGEYARMEEMSRRVLATIERLGITRLAPMANRALGQALIGLGRLDEAAVVIERSHAMAMQTGDRRVSSTSALAMAHIHYLRGNYDEAGRSVDAAISDKEITNAMTRFFPRVLAMLAHIRNAQGRTQEALDAAAQSYHAVQKLESLRPSDASVAYSVYAQLLLAEQQREAGREVLHIGRTRLYNDVAKLDDPTMREQILNQFENAELLKQAAAELDNQPA